MMRFNKKIIGMVVCLFHICSVLSAFGQDGFSQADRDRLTRLEAAQTVFMQQTDKRFEELRTDINKRFEELRADMNARFEQIDKRFEQIDKRFEQVDKRFEELRTDMNARFEQTTSMFYTLAAMFSTLFAAVFGFAWWDRRSILITARKVAREETEERTRGIRDGNYKVDRLIDVLRSLAEKMPDLKELMHRANLL